MWKYTRPGPVVININDAFLTFHSQLRKCRLVKPTWRTDTGQVCLTITPTCSRESRKLFLNFGML